MSTDGGTLLTTPPASTAGADAAAVAAAAAAAAQSEGKPPVNGAAPAGFRFALPDELKDNDSLKKYLLEDGTIDGHVLAKSYVNASSLIGRDKIVIPKSDEEWDAAYKALGRPDDENGYEFTKPEKMPEGFYNEDDEKTFRQWAKANGLNKKQAAALYDGYVKTQLERVAAWQEKQGNASKEAEANLRREWGDAADGQIALAKAAFVQFADPDFKAYLDSTGLGNDPRLIRAFNKIGREMMGEGKLEGGPSTVPPTPADLDKAMGEFRSQHYVALSDKRHPDYKRLNAELQQMVASRWGNTPYTG